MPVKPSLSNYSQLPEPVSGYELNPNHGLFSVIVPEATTNLVINPSVEFEVTTGYTAVAGAMAATYEWQAYGACGLKLTPAVSTESGFYYGTVSLTATKTYTASVVIQGEAGKTYYIWFATTGGAALGTKRKWIGTGHKQRIWVTFTETSTTTRRIYVTRDAAYADQNLFYADGLQVEEKSYPTTYCDGDQTGFVTGQIAYWWNGSPRASTSSRSAQATAGGREYSLLDLGFRILSVMGLGMPSFADQALPMPGRGELSQGTGDLPREFTLAGDLYSPGHRRLQSLRAGLIRVFSPYITNLDQPLILRYQPLDEDGTPWGESLDIICKYRGGLEGTWASANQERLAITFKMHTPQLRSTYYSGAGLTLQDTVAGTNYILRNLEGLWATVGTGLDNTVYDILEGNDGVIYVAGIFTTAGGLPNTNGIAKWHPDGSYWEAMGTGSDDNGVICLAKDSQGRIYAGGEFTGMGGVANTQGIARWNGTAWESIGNIGGTGYVYAMAATSPRYLAVGGNFNAAGGIAAASIALYDTNIGVWSPYGAGCNNTIYALAYSLDENTLYIGGTFTTAGGHAYPYLARIVAGIYWESVTAKGSGVDGPVNAIRVGFDGKVYIGGEFNSADGLPNTLGIARWTGTQFESLGIGIVAKTAFHSIRALELDASGNLYIGGIDFGLSWDDPTNPQDYVIVFTGSHFQRVPFGLPVGAPPGPLATILAVYQDLDRDTLYFGFNTAGNTTIAASNTVNTGDLNVYPILVVVGPGLLFFIENAATGKRIYFNRRLGASERIVVNLDPVLFSAVSNLSGNILATLQATEGFDLGLLPGDNDLRIHIVGTSGATQACLYWQNQYLSIDTAIWE